MHSRKAAGRTCSSASWLTWAVYQVAPSQVTIPWTIENSIFDVAVWQALFYTGLVIGFHRASLASLGQLIGRRSCSGW